jgi:hypothetical protein
MQKASYGLLRSALLFYKKLVKDLENYGFEINPYDPCVANMMIDGKQMTVIWHVDDLKVSHVDAFKLTKFASYLSSIYGGLAVHRGKKHDYLPRNEPGLLGTREGRRINDSLPQHRFEGFPGTFGGYGHITRRRTPFQSARRK